MMNLSYSLSLYLNVNQHMINYELNIYFKYNILSSNFIKTKKQQIQPLFLQYEQLKDPHCYLNYQDFTSKSDYNINFPYLEMKLCYPLKKSDPTNLVQPIVKYLQLSESPQIAMSFRDNLTKINQLRDKVCQFQLPNNPTVDMLNKYIPAVQMYAKYALTLAKHLNWNKDYGVTVNDLNLTWHDSFNPGLTFMKSQIHYDIFCCFYNIAIMYFHKANILCMEDLINSKKQSIRAAKIAFYLFNQVRTVYYPTFMNTGFSDTNHSNLQMLQLLSQGLIYKNLFNLFKQDEYKLGINNIASIAGQAQKKFYNAYQIGVQFFMKSSNIPANLKGQLLSFAYVEALYHDSMFNTKYAKYYKEEMDQNKDNIIYLIAYERKALRLLELGLKNQSVTHLLDSRPDQRKDLENILPQLRSSLEENLLRNKEIYQKQEITEQKIPTPMQTPKKYIAQPIQPDNIKINYDNPIAAPFAKLVDNESKGFMAQLREFGQNRTLGLQSAKTKLTKNIETIYNDHFVNYYLNLEANNKNKGIPESLRQKIQQIQSNGGKKKLDLEIQIIKKNDQQISNRFKQMLNTLKEQESYDMQKRNQYGQKWNRPPSNVVNRTYFNQVQVYQKKSQQASVVNQKIIDKYHALQKYIKVVDEDQSIISKSLPKVEVTKFLEENSKQFEKLRKGVTGAKSKQEQLDNLADDIKKFFNKIDYNQQANKNFKQAQLQGQKQKIFQRVFGQAYKMIQKFNQKAKQLQNEAKQVGQISNTLNKKNKGDQKSKKDFQEVLSRFNQISNLFRDVAQGTGFYTKINQIMAKILSDLEGFIAARQMQAQQLENSVKKGGFGAGQNLPSMYPNQAPQQNLGFYIPPPMNFTGVPQQKQNYTQNSDMSDMLADIMKSKPNFGGGDVFGGPVFQSQWR